MTRTHDYHCSNCHEWVNGFYVDDGGTCGCGNPDLFYDLNHEAACCEPATSLMRLFDELNIGDPEAAADLALTALYDAGFDVRRREA